LSCEPHILYHRVPKPFYYYPRPQSYPAMADDKPNCKVILANNIAKSLLEEVRDGLSKMQRKPLLVGFLSSADPAARVYAEWTGKTCVEK
jgi:hypothetical protein